MNVWKTKKYNLFIDNEFIEPEKRKYYDVIDPARNLVLAKAPLGDEEDAKKAIDSARNAFDKGEWPRMTPGERASYLLKLADLFEKDLKRLSYIESLNVGKPIKLAMDSDLPFALDNLRFFAGASRILEGKSATNYIAGGVSMIRREPIGVVSCIIPWNYPLMIAIWKSIPALAVGNCVVLKPSSYTPMTAYELAELVKKSGIPKGVINIISGPGGTLGKELTENSGVDMISFTGSTTTGTDIMKRASSTVKKLNLELGGKAPFIIYEDADLDAASEGTIAASFVNSGQDCTAETRIYVHEKVYDEFIAKILEKIKKIKLGNPQDWNTDLGPLVSKEQLEKVERYANLGVKEGARLLYGGKRAKIKGFEEGFFFEPTLFADVEQDMHICQEEIFGPIIGVSKFSEIDEAIDNANDIVYGLAASVWTKNIARALETAKEIKAGTVWINDHLPLASEMPHGGYKLSGFGKDLSVYALEDYTNIKHIYVDLTEKQRKDWHYTIFGPKS
jgi:betaine-aldehyde dehydrogenase